MNAGAYALLAQGEDGGVAGPNRRWAFVNGESHTANEDAILSKIDRERAAAIISQLAENRGTCEECGRKNVPLSLCRGNKMKCTPCRRAQWQPLVPLNVVREEEPERQRRGGPYYVQVPGEPKRIVDAKSKKQAAELTARRLGRTRIPKGTRIWAA